MRRERLAALGQLAATVSHEIRNPLGTIRNAVYTLDENLTGDEFSHIKDVTELAQRNIDRCDRIINEMLDFTRQRELIVEKMHFDNWLMSILKETDVPEGVVVRRDLNCGSEVSFDVELIRRALINILTNAFQSFMNYEAGQKVIAVSTWLEEERLSVAVEDNGPGISEENLEKIFEPLFSTKGFGVGLGMAIVHNIISDHNGEISVESSPGEGARVMFTIPVDTQA